MGVCRRAGVPASEHGRHANQPRGVRDRCVVRALEIESCTGNRDGAIPRDSLDHDCRARALVHECVPARGAHHFTARDLDGAQKHAIAEGIQPEVAGTRRRPDSNFGHAKGPAIHEPVGHRPGEETPRRHPAFARDAASGRFVYLNSRLRSSALARSIQSVPSISFISLRSRVGVNATPMRPWSSPLGGNDDAKAVARDE